MRVTKKVAGKICDRRLLAMLLFALFLVFAPLTAGADEPAAEGIDVSRWQGTINWAGVKQAGVDFAMIGIGYYRNGIGIADPFLKYNLEQANVQGIHVGVYLYSYATSVEEARQEADFVLDQIDGYRISYPVAFDMEDTVQRGLTRKERTDIAVAFLEMIEEAGYYPMFYASQSWLYDFMDLSRLAKYDKWVANWAPSVSFSPTAMWQYSSAGKVQGIVGNVDLNHSYKDYAKLVVPRTTALRRRSRSGWRTDGKNFWYVDENGEIPKGCIKTINGKKYLFSGKGYRVSGWARVGGKYYYFLKKDGSMKKGWLTYSGKRYYLDKKTGERRSGFVKLSGKTFYFSKTGVLQKKAGWIVEEGERYYLNEKGVVQTGWLTVNGAKYYLGADGKMQKGWLTLDGKRYYLRIKDGRALSGWLKYQGKYYYLRKIDQVMKKGWLTYKGKRYYLGKDGVRRSGWQRISGKWYYFSKNGVMQKNRRIGKYVLGANGVCVNRR